MRFWIYNFIHKIDNRYATLWLDRNIDILNCSYKTFYITIYKEKNNKKKVIFRLPFSVVSREEGKPNFEIYKGGYSYQIKILMRLQRINIITDGTFRSFSQDINYINIISYMSNHFDIDYKYGGDSKTFRLAKNISGRLTVQESYT